MQISLFEHERITLSKAIALTVEGLRQQELRRWTISFSGGKDSTTVTTLVASLIKEKEIPRPESLHIIYADTQMELPPLHFAALELMQQLEGEGIKTKIVRPELDRQFFVYMLGRGVPPPNNTFRWCVGTLKVNPMGNYLEDLHHTLGEQRFLSLTGVRIGESAARDQRIALSCSKDGTECSQGYLQSQTPQHIATIYHPIIHWRVCNVFDWLTFMAPGYGYPTASQVALVYGGDEAQELNARTGCNGCNVAQKETALDYVLRMPEWSYLAPLKRLKPFYREIEKPQYRHRKVGGELKADGSLVTNQNRLGPLTMEARRWGLEQILSIQSDINCAAIAQGRPTVTLVSEQAVERIEWHWRNNIFPDKWDGTEPVGSQPFDRVLPDGSVQPWLF